MLLLLKILINPLQNPYNNKSFFFFRDLVDNDSDIFDEIEKWNSPNFTSLQKGKEALLKLTRKIVEKTLSESDKYNNKELQDLIQLLFEKMNLRLVSAFIKLYAKHDELNNSYAKLFNSSNSSDFFQEPNSYNKTDEFSRNMANFTTFLEHALDNSNGISHQTIYYICTVIIGILYAGVDRMLASKVSKFLGLPQSRWNKIFFPSLFMCLRFCFLKITRRNVTNRYETGQNRNRSNQIEIDISMDDMPESQQLHYLYNGAQAIADSFLEPPRPRNPFLFQVAQNIAMSVPVISQEPTTNALYPLNTNQTTFNNLLTASYRSLPNVPEQSIQIQTLPNSNPFL